MGISWRTIFKHLTQVLICNQGYQTLLDVSQIFLRVLTARPGPGGIMDVIHLPSHG